MEFSWLNLCLIVFVAWVAGTVVQRLGFPAVLGELGAGIIFGPPLLGLVYDDNGIRLLGRLGILMMLLFIGTSIHPRDLAMASRTATWPTIGGFVVPFILGYLATIWLGGTTNESLIVGVVLGTTALATMSRVVVDLNLLDTRLGQTLMAIAIFSIIIVLVVFSAILALAETGSVPWDELAVVLGKAFLFLVVVTILGLYGFPILGKVQKRLHIPGRTAELTFAVLIGTAFASMAEWFGLNFILGAFLAGLFMRQEMFEPGTFTAVFSDVHDVSIGFLAPIFYVSAGFNVSFTTFQNPGLLLTIIAVSLLGKLLGGLPFYLLTGRGWREALVVSLAMNTRGGTAIILAGTGLNLGLLSQDVFTALIFAIFLSTLSVPIGLKIGADWLERCGELVHISDVSKQGQPNEEEARKAFT